MLKSMRAGSQHFITKALFLLLALSFVTWGIGDVFRDGVGRHYVAKVGNTKISQHELEEAFRKEVENYQRMTGKNLSEAEIEKLGVKQYILNQLVLDKAMKMELVQLKIRAGDSVLADYISGNPDFFDKDGKFDKAKYTNFLKQSGLTEEKLLSLLKDDVERKMILGALESAVKVPNILATEIFKSKEQRRIADIFILKAANIQVKEQPSAAELDEFYQKHQDEFKLPEKRAVTYFSFGPADVKKDALVTESAITEYYNKNIDQYKELAAKDVDQYLFDDEATAKAAYEKIKQGDDKSYAKNKTSLGFVNENSLFDEIKNVIFDSADTSAKITTPKITAPVKTALGWHVFAIKSIKQGSVKDLKTVYDQIKAELEKDTSYNELSTLSGHVEDEFAAGKALEDVASKFSLKVSKLAEVTRDINIAELKNLPDANQIIFALDANQNSSINIGSDNQNYYVFRVDKVTPERIQNLDEVKKDAIAKWQKFKQQQLLQTKAEQLQLKLKSAKDQEVQAVAASFAAEILKAKNFTRETETIDKNIKINPNLVADLFSIKTIGEVTQPYANQVNGSEAGGDIVVAKLAQIIEPDLKKQALEYNNVALDLANDIRNDIIEQYVSYLKDKYKVEIY